MSVLKPLSGRQVVTLLILIAVGATLIGWDVWVAFIWGGDPTISWTVTLLSLNNPIIPFGFGVLAGHLWWPQKMVPDLTKDGATSG